MRATWIPAILAVQLVACTGARDSDDNAILVGAIFALTGPTADVGTLYAEGVPVAPARAPDDAQQEA